LALPLCNCWYQWSRDSGKKCWQA